MLYHDIHCYQDRKLSIFIVIEGNHSKLPSWTEATLIKTSHGHCFGVNVNCLAGTRTSRTTDAENAFCLCKNEAQRLWGKRVTLCPQECPPATGKVTKRTEVKRPETTAQNCVWQLNISRQGPQTPSDQQLTMCNVPNRANALSMDVYGCLNHLAILHGAHLQDYMTCWR